LDIYKQFFHHTIILLYSKIRIIETIYMIPDNMEIVMVGGKGKRSLAKNTRDGLTAINKLGTLPSSWSTSSTT
jgi:hypothetical protein